MAIRTIQSPGIEITERDISQYTTGPVGTAVLVTGFAAKGRDYEPIYLTSRSAWLQQFGEPTTEAERYFFNASMEVINQGGKLYACKLPYKNEALNKFTTKSYVVDVSKLKQLSTVAEYVEKYDLSGILAGDYTRFGWAGPDKEFLTLLFQAKDIEASLKDFSEAVDNYTIAIPYAYAEDDWMNQINIEGTDQDNWMYTPVQFIMDKLSAVFDATSTFNLNLPRLPQSDDWYLISSYFVKKNEGESTGGSSLIPLSINYDAGNYVYGNAEFSVKKFIDDVEKMLGDNPKTQAFKVACDPSTGVTSASIDNTFHELFTNSDPYKFFVANKDLFDALNKIDFNGDDKFFGGLKPYFYCDENKFNLGAYWKASKDYERSKQYKEQFDSLSAVPFWNDVVKLDAYFDENKPELSGIFDKPIQMAERDGTLTGFIDGELTAYANLPIYINTEESNIALKRFLIRKQKEELLTPLDYLLEAFQKLFESAKFDELVEASKKGLYQNTPFARTALDYYMGQTLIPNPTHKTMLRDAGNLNVLYGPIDPDGEYGSLSADKTFFQVYNGPDSSAPELSSVDDVVVNTVNRLNYDKFLAFAKDFTETPSKLSVYEKLSAYAQEHLEDKPSLMSSIIALQPSKISVDLAFSEIKKADGTIKQYLQIDSKKHEVALKDLEEIDGYATGETPVMPNTFVIVDKTRGTLGTSFAKNPDGTQKELVGIIPVVTTAANALYAQALLETGDSGITKYNALGNVRTLKYIDSNGEEHGPQVVDINNGDSAIPFKSDNAGIYTVSQMVAASFPSIHFTAEGLLDRQNMKKIGVVVLRAFLDPGEGNKLNYDIVEAYAGELSKDAVDPNTGASTFIDTLINTQSEYIEFYSNCFNQTATKELYSKMDLLVLQTPQDAGDLGFYQDMVKKNISLTDSITKALPLVWEKNEDINEKQIDIVCDAGVSNIAQYIKSVFNGRAGEYDPASENASLFKLRSKEDTNTWRAVIAMYDNFCKNIRKDCMFVADGPRPFCLTGNKKIVRPSKPSNTIDATILPMLKFITGVNTNYGAGYCDWFQKSDEFSGDYFWCPPSIQATGVYLNTDINFDFWEAPAGLNRGIVPALDIAFSPTQRQADEIYPKCWNYARNYPNDGIVLEGQRTFQTKESALDRVAARRALLRFERIVYEIARWYVYETNNAYNRQRFYDDVDGVFKELKAQGAMYDYKIICDETINTDEVIERNEFRVKIGLKLNKFMEFILIEFNILRRGGSWSEML